MFGIKRLSLEYNRLKTETENYVKEIQQLKEQNLKLQNCCEKTIALYEMTKEVCRTLDEEQIFKVFEERAFELDKKDDEKFEILAHQFALGFKRAVLYKKVQESAITDSLTRTLTRRYFLQRFDEELERSKKFSLTFSLLLVDIDRFKEYNDYYGHLVGDVVLREVSATAIKLGIREIDLMARYGGDEFLLLLTETDKAGAKFVAERIRQTIEARQFRAYDEILKSTISVGIASFPEDSLDKQSLIDKADRALYQAKQAGRNKICIYNP
ncbi:MAG: GGDEF domain-containing protein [Candidatus Omnitrophica bacterium]|nr:GGDEF domain-containing protein [Candidatus Omnitrophota bacterium]